MITFLPPPEGVPIDPRAQPYAMENKSNVESFVALVVSKPAFLISANTTGSIIAATVCSPIKDDIKADTVTKPKVILNVLLPVTLIIARANLLSSP